MTNQLQIPLTCDCLQNLWIPMSTAERKPKTFQALFKTFPSKPILPAVLWNAAPLPPNPIKPILTFLSSIIAPLLLSLILIVKIKYII